MRMLSSTNSVGRVAMSDIPLLEYEQFLEIVSEQLRDEDFHILSYFAYSDGDKIRAIILLAQDSTSQIHIASYRTTLDRPLDSLANIYSGAQAFEREISENFGIHFHRHPNPKPLRYSFDRAEQRNTLSNYPFYSIEGESLHEVNVGPIHAGIIEPGVFRFICNGEKVLNLEVVLGFQHRGVERAMEASAGKLRGTLLAESIVGDSVVAHASTYAHVVENLCGVDRSKMEALEYERAIALELERIAMHLSDTAGLSTDIAYQLGQVCCEALRTITINTSQLWCGNRFSKAMIRPCGSNYPLNSTLRAKIKENITDVRRRYGEMARNLLNTPSVLSRFEDCGVVPRKIMVELGCVGLVARASGLSRDSRNSHPYGQYAKSPYTPIVHSECDVMSRLKMRLDEVEASADYILKLLELDMPASHNTPQNELNFEANTLSFNITEGFRGAVVHSAITDSEGKVINYKIVDPSFHNWYALNLALRSEGISDFPINNKSFNLSYCGHDL